MMHSIKGGWGQTFALAKHNESEGKKSRIRRSKEERKAMVESFIKKYQESNNGNFPSLNLTHKEVGGSFYTVREIVRDIIQENRVLGPAKFTLEELNSDQFFEQNPLGSIARDPQSFLTGSSNENHPEPNKLQDTSGKTLSVSDGYNTEVEHQVVDKGHVINVSHADVTNKESTEEVTVASDGYYTGVEHQVVDKGHVINVSHADVTNKESTEEVTVASDGYYTGAVHQVVDKGHVINVSHADVTNKESTEEVTVASDWYYTGAEHPMIDKGHVVNGSQVDVTNNEYVEATIVSDGYYTGAKHKIVDKGHVMNGSQVDMVNKKSIEATIPEMQVSEPMAPEQNVEQELVAATTPMAKVTAVTEDLIVETFPLRPVVRTTDGMEGLVGELRGPSNSPEKDIQMLELVQAQERSDIEPTKSSNLLDEKFEDALGNQILKNISNTGHDEEKNVRDTLAESTNHSTHKEHFGHEFEDSNDPQVRVSHQNTITLETTNKSKIIDGAKTSIQDGSQAKNLGETYTEGSKPSEEGLHKADKHRVDGQLGGNSPRRSKTTLDRINLESWDGTPKNSAKREPNPLLAIFKAFVDAFVKFWSE